MAVNFSQVDIAQNMDSGDWEFVAKSQNKRKRHPTSTSSDIFESASDKEKLSMIFDEVINIKIDQAGTREMITTSTNQYMQVARDSFNSISAVTNQLVGLLKTLAYKSMDIEARSRRNNLIFRGIREDRYENCSSRVLHFIANTLQIDTEGIVIARAHRLGPLNVGRNYTRPIIANFVNYNDVECIMSNARTLKHCPGYSIDRDMPKEIGDARKRLWGKYKDTKRENPNASVRIVYPAKLMCGNKVIQDEFPDWHSVLHQSRVFTFPTLPVQQFQTDVKSSSNVDVSNTVVSPPKDCSDTESMVIDLSQPRAKDSNTQSLPQTSDNDYANKAHDNTDVKQVVERDATNNDKDNTSAKQVDAGPKQTKPTGGAHASRSKTRRTSGRRRVQTEAIFGEACGSAIRSSRNASPVPACADAATGTSDTDPG